MSLDDLLNPPTSEAVRAEISTELAALGVSDVGFEETSTARRLLDVDAQAQARQRELSSHVARSTSTSLILGIPADEGRDAWIELLARGRQLSRDPATKATHRCVLTNSATGINRVIQPRSLRARAGGIDFLNLDAGTLPVGTSIDMRFEAQLPGTQGNVSPGRIVQLVTTLAGVTINNPAISGQGSSILVAARDLETNESLLDRCDNRWDGIASGTARGAMFQRVDEAFRFAQAVKTVTKWAFDDENPNGPGSADLYLANAAGGATVGEIAIVDPYCQARWRGGAGPLRTLSAVPVPITYNATLKTTNSNAIAKAADADAYYTSILEIGGKVIRNQMIEFLMQIDGMVDVSIDLQNIQLQKYEVAILTGSHALA